MKTKIGIDGKPFDPSERARLATEVLRAFVYTNTMPTMPDCYEVLTNHMNAIADRLQTADALEAKANRMQAAHAELVQAGLDVIDKNLGTHRLVDALIGVNAKPGRKP